MTVDVTRKVRETDIARTNVIATLELVKKRISLKKCADAVEEHIRKAHYLEASRSLQEYCQNSCQELIEFEEISNNSETERLLLASREIENYCVQLETELLSIQLTISSEDKRLLNLCAMYINLGQRRKGIERYVKAVCDELDSSLNKQLDILRNEISEDNILENELSGSTSQQRNSFPDILAALFNEVFSQFSCFFLPIRVNLNFCVLLDISADCTETKRYCSLFWGAC